MPSINGTSNKESSNKETYEALYRPPENKEGAARKHRVQKVTRKQVYIERTPIGEAPAGFEEEGGWVVSRAELERYGFVHHTTTSARFYRSEEAALQAA